MAELLSEAQITRIKFLIEVRDKLEDYCNRFPPVDATTRDAKMASRRKMLSIIYYDIEETIKKISDGINLP